MLVKIQPLPRQKYLLKLFIGQPQVNNRDAMDDCEEERMRIDKSPKSHQQFAYFSEQTVNQKEIAVSCLNTKRQGQKTNPSTTINTKVKMDQGCCVKQMFRLANERSNDFLLVQRVHFLFQQHASYL